jgi:hypothetical protein
VHVTLNHKGLLHIGRHALELFGRPRAVTVYYEPDLGKIALEPADARAKGALTVHPKQFGAAYVCMGMFCREHYIMIVGTHAFREVEINHNGIMILDLNETERVGGWAHPGTVEKYRIRQMAKDLIAAQAPEEMAREIREKY